MLHETEAVIRGGGCCCAARAFPQAHHLGRPSSDVQKILLRFRPIAPRPAPPPPPGSGASTKPPADEEGPGGNKRKRSRAGARNVEGGLSRRTRSTRTRRGPKPKKKPRTSTEEVAAAASSTVTTSTTSSEGEVAFVETEILGCAAAALPLIPSATMELPPQFPTTTELMRVTTGWWDRPQAAAAAGPISRIVAPTPHRPVCSVVTVVVSTAGEWEVDDHPGSAEWLEGCEEEKAEERRMLTDARPTLTSDPSGKVLSVNAAYRRMVGALDDDEDKPTTASCAVERGGIAGGVRTLLVAPAPVLANDKATFSCRVKVRWCGAGRTGRPQKGSITAPCDVCRLADGTLVWRIDVRAALSLAPLGP